VSLAEAPAVPERPPCGLPSRGSTKEWQLSPRALLQPPPAPGPRPQPTQLYRAGFNYTATKPDELRLVSPAPVPDMLVFLILEKPDFMLEVLLRIVTSWYRYVVVITYLFNFDAILKR